MRECVWGMSKSSCEWAIRVGALKSCVRLGFQINTARPARSKKGRESTYLDGRERVKLVTQEPFHEFYITTMRSAAAQGD